MFSSVHARVCVCVCTRTRNVYERQAVGEPLREILGGHRAVISVRINSFEAQDRGGGVPVVLWNIRWRMERKKIAKCDPMYNLYFIYGNNNALSDDGKKKREKNSFASFGSGYIHKLHFPAPFTFLIKQISRGGNELADRTFGR